MKKSVILGMAAALVLAAACTSSNKGFKTETRDYADSTAYAYLTIKAELPVAATEGTTVMRQTLVDVMDKALSHIDNYEQKRAFPRFEGDLNDSEALFSYYEQQALASIGALSQATVDERAAAILESETLSDAEKQAYLDNAPKWGFEFDLKKTWENDKIVVFDSQNYIYMAGAHGGIVGDGPMTFDKESGMRIRDFFEPGSVTDMQKVLRAGMETYFADRMEVLGTTLEDHLNLKDGIIPLPEWSPRPCEEGLTFIYQQYEVAAYVDGMPEFTLSYKDVKPFLLPEAKKDLGL